MRKICSDDLVVVSMVRCMLVFIQYRNSRLIMQIIVMDFGGCGVSSKHQYKKYCINLMSFQAYIDNISRRNLLSEIVGEKPDMVIKREIALKGPSN